MVKNSLDPANFYTNNLPDLNVEIQEFRFLNAKYQ